MNKITPSILAKSLLIEPSQLYVRDLQKVTEYYESIVGLDVLERGSGQVVLGHDELPVLKLIARPEFPNSSVKNAGLFHNAILYQSRSALARAVYRILQQAAWSFEGSADHLVSEAFYFHDPENNGLELYFDRPRSEWKWSNGSVAMDTLYLSPQQYLSAHLESEGVTDKKLGHVHLRVGDVGMAREFYVNALGFDATLDLGSALFVSVGGYHHHMAMNTWFSQGASRRDPALGLGEVRLALPNDGSIERLIARLDGKGIVYEMTPRGLVVNDPWNNQLLLAVD